MDLIVDVKTHINFPKYLCFNKIKSAKNIKNKLRILR